MGPALITRFAVIPLAYSSIQFQSGFLLVTESDRIHLIPSAIGLAPSLHLVRSAAFSIFNPTSHSLPPASSMSVLAVLAFASHSLQHHFLLQYIIIIPSNLMSIPPYSIRLCHSIQRFLLTLHLHQLLHFLSIH